jgi:hypothetical protein
VGGQVEDPQATPAAVTVTPVSCESTGIKGPPLIGYTA